MSESLDPGELKRKVRDLYQDVADGPGDEYHFETGRELAVRLGYPAIDLDRVPSAAVESFAGAGYHIDLAALRYGDDVLDLGSGSGMDGFIASLHVGDGGSVTGVDITENQLRKARRVSKQNDFEDVSFKRGDIENLPFEDNSFDVITSNGVINLAANKEAVFAEVNRVLREHGRVALSDVISETPLPERIKSDANLWVSCIGGAMQINDYTELIETSGLDVIEVRENPPYEFISERATHASQKYGVKSISLGARQQ